MTGISLLGGALGAKRLELLREIVPAAVTIGVLINPENRNVAAERKELETAIATGGQQVVVVSSGPSDDLESAMAMLAQRHVGGLVVTADPILTAAHRLSRSLLATVSQRSISGTCSWQPVGLSATGRIWRMYSGKRGNTPGVF